MNAPAAYNFDPAALLAIVGVLLALGPLAWVGLRHQAATRLRALTVITLFLSFDLVIFGAFTRLTDSGLGCPDWPGCYGHASPMGAHADIHAAQTAMPTGPVTHGKAWIEMIHRYLAAAIGVLAAVLAVAGWRVARRSRAVSPWWSTFTFAWICLQGLFGALTVTMKLYPAIVTLHLLGGLGLLALLAVQAAGHEHKPLQLPHGLRRGAMAVFVLSATQMALGGWVSANYAVLACPDFPTCQGHWWPPMDFSHGFTVLRELGIGKDGGFLPFAALTAIHMVHRIGAALVLMAVALLAWRLFASGQAAQRRWAWALSATGSWQLASGLGNVVLGWPLAAALAHTAGAAALIILLATLLARASRAG